MDMEGTPGILLTMEVGRAFVLKGLTPRYTFFTGSMLAAAGGSDSLTAIGLDL